jgi:hypothetical protein
MNTVCIYYNDKKIFFLSNDKDFNTLPDDNSLVSLSKTRAGIFDDFLAFVDRNDSSQLVFLQKQKQKCFNLFAENFKLIEAAGGIISNKKGQKLFIFRNGKWDLPKGKIEKGETIKKAAVRECEEECGIGELKIIKALPVTWHIYELKGKLVLKKTHWFEMKSDFGKKPVPQLEEGITKVIWAKKTDYKAIRKNTFPSVIDVMRSTGI